MCVWTIALCCRSSSNSSRRSMWSEVFPTACGLIDYRPHNVRVCVSVCACAYVRICSAADGADFQAVPNDVLIIMMHSYYRITMQLRAGAAAAGNSHSLCLSLFIHNEMFTQPLIASLRVEMSHWWAVAMSSRIGYVAYAFTMFVAMSVGKRQPMRRITNHDSLVDKHMPHN